jgi:hypothetical protein
MINYSLVIEGTPVDLFSDEAINLVREIKNFQDLAQARLDYTQQFTIPSSPTNDGLFQNYFDENSVFSGWNAYLKKDAQIFIHSIPIFSGCIELTGVEYVDGLPRQYNIVFYGQVKNAIVDFGEQMLSDVNWDDYDHTVNYNAVIDSWYGNLLSGKILYPIADYYIGLQYCRKPVVPNNWYQQGIQVNDLRPAILLKEIIINVFDNVGVTLGGSLLSKASFNNLYILPMQGAGPIQNTTDDGAKFEATSSAPLVLAGATNFYQDYTYLPLNVATINPTDYSTTNYEYTAPKNGVYEFEFSCDITSITTSVQPYQQGISFAFLVNNQLAYFDNFVNTTGTYTITTSLQLNVGDEVAVGYFTNFGATVATPIFKTNKVPFGLEGSIMDMSLVMPKVKVTDFINSVLKAFNAVIIPISADTYEIHNIDDYYALGTTKDWTRYIDVKNIRHEKIAIPKLIEMKHAEGLELASQEFQSVNQRRFGEVKASPIVDFAKDELMVESIFNVLTPSLIREVNDKGEPILFTDLQFPIMLDKDGSAVVQPLTLFYYAGRKSTTFTYQLNNQTQYEYPLCSSYSAFPTTTASYSLGFGLEVTINGDMASNTMFVTYWQKYLSRMFSTKSRIVYFSAILPVNEWLNLQLNDTIAVSGNYYKIQAIQYDMLNEKAQLELITYPDVQLLYIQSNGLTPEWTNATETPNGITTLSGDIFAKQVTNAINIYGGYAVDVLADTSFQKSNQVKFKGVIDRLLKRTKVKIAQLSGTANIITPSDQTYVVIPLNTEYNIGDGSEFVFDNANDWIYYKYGGQLQITSTVSIQHSHGHDVGFAILVDGKETLGNANMGSTDQSTSVSCIVNVAPEQKIQIAMKCLDNHSSFVRIKSANLRVELL